MKRKPTSYTVGYRKPPKERRFKKGQSGNPKGRPKKVVKSESFYKLAIDELDTSVTIADQGKNLRLSKRALIVKQIVNKAAKGERWALNALLSLLNFSQNDDERIGVQFVIGDPEIFLEKHRQQREAEALRKSAEGESLGINGP